jgi:thioredoxin 1
MKTAKYFTATWCGPCQQFKPIMEELKSDGLPIEIIDIDSNEDLAREFVVRSVPTTIIMDGEVEVERFIGAKTKRLIKNRLGE